MKNYDFKLEIEDDKIYSKENFPNFTNLIQYIFYSKENISNKDIYFVHQNNQVFCYDKANSNLIYNKFYNFFMSNKENYDLKTLKILFSTIDETGNEINNIFKEKSSKEILEISSQLIKKVISIINEDYPSVKEVYILNFREEQVILYRIYLQKKN